MSPVLHIEATPRVPGDSLRGKRPHDYGPGRVCALPGCTTILRRTHAGPHCDPCQDNGRCEQRGSMDRKEREAAVLEYLRPRDGWITSVEMAKALGIPKGTLTGTLGRMVGEGTLVSRVPALGGGYRTPAAGGVVASLPKTTPDLIPPAPAPPTSREQPADPAAAPAPIDVRTSLGPPPFAGIDYELVVIGEVVRRIESLTGHETRVRVAAYVASRFL